MIKVELHAHTSDDPADRIPHDTHALLDRAAQFGYGALAITLHNRWFDPAPFGGDGGRARARAPERHREDHRRQAHPVDQRAT